MDTSQVVVLILGVVACGFDLKTRHIPNILTLGGATAAVAYAFTSHGIGGGLTSVGGWATGLMLFLPFFALGGMGAGDVKLVACIGAWLGPFPAMWVALYAAIAGGVMALIVATATGYLGQACRNLWLLLAHWRVVGIRPLDELTLERSGSPRLPYALPIAAGTVAAIWLQAR
jgi:prepilin peptidase CpaA